MPARQCGAGVELEHRTAANTPPPKVISLVGKTPESVRALAPRRGQPAGDGQRRSTPFGVNGSVYRCEHG